MQVYTAVCFIIAGSFGLLRVLYNKDFCFQIKECVVQNIGAIESMDILLAIKKKPVVNYLLASLNERHLLLSFYKPMHEGLAVILTD